MTHVKLAFSGRYFDYKKCYNYKILFDIIHKYIRRIPVSKKHFGTFQQHCSNAGMVQY